MIGRSKRRQRLSSRKSTRARNRTLRGEQLEARALLSGNGITPSANGDPSAGAAAMVGAAKVTNAPPTIQQFIINGNAAVTGKTATVSVSASDDGGATNLVYKWSVMSAPSGGTATFATNNAKGANSTIVTFTKAGSYSLAVTVTDSGGLTASAIKSVTVTPVIASVKNLPTAFFTVSGTNLQLPAATLADQFGNSLPGPFTLTWATSSMPSGAPAPTFSSNSSGTVVNFGMAGTYILTARFVNYPSVSYAIMATVNQTLTSIALSPNTATIYQGATQQFIPQAFDQFKRSMSNLQTYTWSAPAARSMPPACSPPRATPGFMP